MSSLDKQIDGTHYKDMGLQPWEIIEKNRLDYFEGAALKYLLRWKVKDGVIDLDKIIHYVERIKEMAQAGHYGEQFINKSKLERRHMWIIRAFNTAPSGAVDTVPIGYIPEGGFMGTEPPMGWIECLGQNTEDLKEYPELYKILKAGGIERIVDIGPLVKPLEVPHG